MNYKVENGEVRKLTNEDLRQMEMDERLLPDVPIRKDTIEALDRYLNKGIPTGHFLQAVLENDLFGAFARADGYNRAALYNIVRHIYQRFPGGSFGSRELVAGFLKRRREEQDACDFGQGAL